MNKQIIISIVSIMLLGNSSWARLSVVTTVPDLKAIVEEVGKDNVIVVSIGKGTQDPHYIEAKPSFMVKSSRADLIVAIGLDLEIGWLPSIVRGSRNPKIGLGQKGYLEVGPLVSPLEAPQGQVTRADGDVHPFGNPHVTLDPVRAGEIAVRIADRLAELDPDHRETYKSNANMFQKSLNEKLKNWESRIKKSSVQKVITYHKTFTYFLDRFHITGVDTLEPKPGVPPTSGHILEIIERIKKEKIPVILVENYFDPTVTNKIKQEVPNIRVKTVAVSVDGASGINNVFDLYESLVKSIEQ